MKLPLKRRAANKQNKMHPGFGCGFLLAAGTSVSAVIALLFWFYVPGLDPYFYVVVGVLFGFFGLGIYVSIRSGLGYSDASDESKEVFE